MIVVFILSALWIRDCGGKLGLVLMGGAMLSKSLIQFSADGRGCVPSLLFENEVAQSCLTVCDSMDCSPPGSSVHGIF